MTYGTTQPAHGRKPPDQRHGARIYTDTTLNQLAIRYAARSTPPTHRPTPPNTHRHRTPPPRPLDPHDPTGRSGMTGNHATIRSDVAVCPVEPRKQGSGTQTTPKPGDGHT